jgi:hypothetical protein
LGFLVAMARQSWQVDKTVDGLKQSKLTGVFLRTFQHHLLDSTALQSMHRAAVSNRGNSMFRTDIHETAALGK